MSGLVDSGIGTSVVAQALQALPWSSAARCCPSRRVSAPEAARRKEDVNRRNPDGSTPLQWAVYKGDVAEAKRLLRAGADVSLANNYGATPMSLAAEVGNTEMLKVLLEAGANADSPNPDGQTALLAVARTGNVEAAQLLLDHGATVDAREKWGGQTALMWASARRHPEMMQLLISKGADVNARSIDRDYQRHVTAEGRPEEPRQRRLDAAALRRARELRGVRGRAAQEQGGHRPAGSRRRLAAAPRDHERQLGSGEAADRGRRRCQSVGHLRRSAAVHGGRPAQSRSTADARRSIRPNTTKGLAIVNLLLERGADPNMQLFFKPANVRGAARIHAGRHAADSRGHQRRPRGRQAAARTWRRRDRLHGGPADADPCGARGPRPGAAGARADQASCRRPAPT